MPSCVVVLLLLFVARAGSTATLDVAEDGADLVFTWDTGPDGLLRGTTPDDLQPWLVSVSSPLRIPNENLLRGEDAFYRLASGSNMAMRLERTFDVPDALRPVPYAVTFPERHAFTTAFELFQKWPTLVEAIWVDGTQGRTESATRRVDGTLIGDDEPIPRHGGAWLEFTTTTSLTLVGSSDDTYAGMVAADLDAMVALLAVPPDSRRLRAVEILCGEENVDWFDVNVDGIPDECGADTNGDTLPDTGLFAGPAITLSESTLQSYLGVVHVPILDTDRFQGMLDLAVERGEGLLLSPPRPTANLPFRPPRW